MMCCCQCTRHELMSEDIRFPIICSIHTERSEILSPRTEAAGRCPKQKSRPEAMVENLHPWRGQATSPPPWDGSMMETAGIHAVLSMEGHINSDQPIASWCAGCSGCYTYTDADNRISCIPAWNRIGCMLL